MGQDAGWKAFGFLVYWEGGGRGLFARGLARTLVCLRYAPPRPENSSMQAPLDGQAPAATTMATGLLLLLLLLQTAGMQSALALALAAAAACYCYRMVLIAAVPER